MLNFWKNSGFEILFGISILIIIIVLLKNFLTGKKGTYKNHSSFMKTLLTKSYDKSYEKKNIKNQVGNEIHAERFESKGEIECKRIIEKLTGKQFLKQRPIFLKNDIINGNNLELDLYNPELKLAIEYNGEQHYKFIPYFHKSKEAFYNLKYRDDLKKRLCKKNNIKLIEIPYTIKINDIEQEIKKNFEKI